MRPQRHEHPHSAPEAPEGQSSRIRGKAAIVALLVITVGGVALIAAFSALGGGRTAASGMAAPPEPATAPPLSPASPLEADHELHEFGDVPIGGGTVEAVFTLTNTGSDATRIVAAYTSCMCTTATLLFPDGTDEGPFGMPGHELPLTLDGALGAREAVAITVRFDPAAHGPDAMGPVERMVNIHTADGGTSTLTLTANIVRG